MIKHWAISLLCLGLFILFPGILRCQNSVSYQDTLFVVQVEEYGAYTMVTGSIIKLTSKEIMILTENGKLMLYTPRGVRRVRLDLTHPSEHWEIANIYWNKEKSQIVKAVQATPIIGPYLSFLSDLAGPSGTILAVVILLAILFYGAYKLYDMLIVTKNLRNLNSYKLDLEIRKLSYEMEGLGKQEGETEKVVTELEPSEEIKERFIPDKFEIPQVHILDFLKYKILRMLSEEERLRRTESWRNIWQSYHEKPILIRVLRYRILWLLNWFLLIVVASFSIGAFVDAILPFVDPDFLDGSSPFISVLFLLLFIAAYTLLIRLNSKRKIMVAAYREVFGL